ncbi:MAG: glycosyltransferase [Cyanobacteria bacterium P01_H01_bin.15]
MIAEWWIAEIPLGLVIAIWLILLVGRRGFWLCDQRLETSASFKLTDWPKVCALIPARNEADVLPQALRSRLAQTYPGELEIILIDDQSTDGTAEIARKLGEGSDHKVTVLNGQALPAGWTGKLWALEQGWRFAQESRLEFIWLTDADIETDVDELARLVSKAIAEKRDLVSLMVQLRCECFWEALLIPAFVFFFQKLYPFPVVNDPKSKLGAAAGGCALISTAALQKLGGFGALRNALIDDCTLGQQIKDQGRSIWLGLSTQTISLRPYPTLASIWSMITRTAYTQLYYSPVLLVGTLFGMVLIYLWAPGIAIASLLTQNWPLFWGGMLGWGLMAIAYFPTVRLYQLNPFWSLILPVAGFLYTLMTLDSARQHWQGQGGAWKGRTYGADIQ